MGKYIDKERIVAEIERLKECNRKICAGDFEFLKKSYPERYYSTEAYNNILSFIDTLKVKEVDLKNEIANLYESNYEDYLTYEEFAYIADYFFELGIKAQKGE